MSPGDEAVAALARERWGGLVGYAFMLTGSRAHAEDLVQDALVKVVLRGRDGTDLHAAEAYVRRTIMSIFLDQHRRTARWGRVRHLVAVDEAAQTHGDHANLTATQMAVRDALATLGPRERACVVLRHLEDRTVAETAAILGVSDGAVKRYTSTALTRLEGLLGPLETHDVTPIERTARP